MSTDKHQTQDVEKLREKIAALVKRSSEKLAEMKEIQNRIELLAAEVERADKKSTASRRGKSTAERRDSREKA
jgi:uncharacterized small protein (DUF1192 family)